VEKRYMPETRGLTPVVVREAATILGETERTLRKQIASGRYPLLAGPQARERVLLPDGLVEDHERRRSSGEAGGSAPSAASPVVRYAMTPEAVSRVAERALRVYTESAAHASRELREHYALRLVAQERAIASQAALIAELEGRAARAEARAAAEAERHRRLHDRLLALVEGHASRKFVDQVGRLIGIDRE